MSGLSVQTEGLGKKFGSFLAVDSVSIAVEQGEIFGFLGANGAGKTTMIRMLCGLLKPSFGEGWVAGFNIWNESEQIKHNIGYMSQKFSLYNDLTISENVDFYGGIYGLNKPVIEKKKTEILETLQLSQWKDVIAGELPPGFKQGLALGTALLHDPLIIFLDEPTSGVDPASRRKFWNLIHQTATKGKTVFVTTHFMDEAEYCNRISIMSAGKIVAIDTPENLKNKFQLESIQQVFMEVVKEKNE
jgi:ABC-2 type transport system ATP-binding protein